MNKEMQPTAKMADRVTYTINYKFNTTSAVPVLTSGEYNIMLPSNNYKTYRFINVENASPYTLYIFNKSNDDLIGVVFAYTWRSFNIPENISDNFYVQYIHNTIYSSQRRIETISYSKIVFSKYNFEYNISDTTYALNFLSGIYTNTGAWTDTSSDFLTILGVLTDSNVQSLALVNGTPFADEKSGVFTYECISEFASIKADFQKVKHFKVWNYGTTTFSLVVDYDNGTTTKTITVAPNEIFEFEEIFNKDSVHSITITGGVNDHMHITCILF